MATVGIANIVHAEFFLERHTDAQFPARDSALGIEHDGSVWMMLRFRLVDFVWGEQPQLKELSASRRWVYSKKLFHSKSKNPSELSTGLMLA